MGPVRAEWGRVGPSRAGEGLDMHWDSIKLLGNNRVGPVRAKWAGEGLGMHWDSIKLL